MARRGGKQDSNPPRAPARPRSNPSKRPPVSGATTATGNASTQLAQSSVTSPALEVPSTHFPSESGTANSRIASEDLSNPDAESEEEQDRIGAALGGWDEPRSDEEDEPGENRPSPRILRSASNPTRSTSNSSTATTPGIASRSGSSSNTRQPSATFQATEVALPGHTRHSRVNSGIFGPSQLPLPLPRPQHQPSTQPIPSTVQPIPPELAVQLFSMAHSSASGLLLPGPVGRGTQQPSPTVTAVSLPPSRDMSFAPSMQGGSRPPLSGQKRTQEDVESQDNDAAAKEQRQKEKKKKYNDARPRLNKYNQDANLFQVIQLAMTYMKIETATVSPFPDNDLRHKNSGLFFSQALGDLDISPEAYVPDVEQLRLIRGEDGNARSAVKKAVDPLVATYYGLITGPTPQEAVANRARAAFLLENSRFHFKNLETRQGMFQNEFVAKAVMAAWFSHPNALGCLHQQNFRPIRLESLALILTVIRHSLSQWQATGKCEKVALRADEYNVYDDFLEALHQYREHSAQSAQTLQSYQMRLFKRALASAGVQESEPDRTPVIQITDDAMEAEMAWQGDQDELEDEDFA